MTKAFVSQTILHENKVLKACQSTNACATSIWSL